MRLKKISKVALAICIAGSTIFSSIPVNALASEKVVVEQMDAIIEQKLADMTLEQKIGQMLQVDFRQWNGQDHTVLSDEVANIIDKYDLGGVILFAENVKETAQTTKLVHDLQEVVKTDESNDVPLLITVDQEGGIVTRLGTGTNLPGNMAIGATRSSEYAYNTGKIIGSELNSLGINVNFAPVLDVNNNPANPVIGVRSISSDPSLVGELGSSIMSGIQDQGVSATAKHFPGHGDTATDSHYGLPVVDKSLEELEQTELAPFKTAISQGIDMIMTGHIGMPQIESEVVNSSQGEFPLPSTLSDDVITGILREHLGYDGVVITDALNMKAISDNFSESQAVIKTINAGVDIALMPTILRSEADVYKLETIINDVINAVNSGEISMNRIDDSVKRVLKLKLERGIYVPNDDVQGATLEEKIANAQNIVGSAEHKAMEKEISEAAVTLVKNEEHTLPFKPKKNANILVVAPAKDQTDSMIRSISNLEKKGTIKDVNVEFANYNSKTPHIEENEVLRQQIERADYVIVGSNVNNSAKLQENSVDHYVPEEIIRYSNELDKDAVMLSLRNPYDVAAITEAKAQIVIYGFKGDPNGPDSEAGNQKAAGPNLPAGIGAIFGDFKPQGKLPVDVPVVENGVFKEETHMPFGFGFKNWNR